MVTRSGDLDPSVVTYLMKKENLSAQEMEDILNKESGLSGMSNLKPDFRVIENTSVEGQPDALMAVETFNYSIASYIAKYAVAMNGVDYIIFTGGIGENQINIRKGICEKLAFMGVKIDLDENNMRGEEKVISTPDSTVKVYVIPTNEELMIAKETLRLVKIKCQKRPSHLTEMSNGTAFFDRNKNKTDIIEINSNYICFVVVFKLSFLVIEDINFRKFLIIFY